MRVVHVVSAFAVGHSTTLALATLGLVHVPSRLVESLIALSILVSAVHALIAHPFQVAAVLALAAIAAHDGSPVLALSSRGGGRSPA